MQTLQIFTSCKSGIFFYFSETLIICTPLQGLKQVKAKYCGRGLPCPALEAHLQVQMCFWKQGHQFEFSPRLWKTKRGVKVEKWGRYQKRTFPRLNLKFSGWAPLQFLGACTPQLELITVSSPVRGSKALFCYMTEGLYFGSKGSQAQHSATAPCPRNKFLNH